MTEPLLHYYAPESDVDESALLVRLLHWGGLPDEQAAERGRALLGEYQTLPAVLAASWSLTPAQAGLSGRALGFLRLCASLTQRYLALQARDIHRLDTPQHIYSALIHQFQEPGPEKLFAFMVNGAGQYLGCVLAAYGETVDVELTAPWLLQQAVRFRADGIILAHNHPDGSPVFSRADIEGTLDLSYQLSGAGIFFHDHYLFTHMRMLGLRDQLSLSPHTFWPTTSRAFQ